MDCNETRRWLHGYLDGELDLAHTLEVERHLEECSECAQARDNHMALHTSIAAADLKYRCPGSLRTKIEIAVRREAGPTQIRPTFHRRWFAVAAGLLFALGASWFAVRWQSHSVMKGGLAQDVVASHVRSLLVDHLTDVASSDRHTVKPWFSGKLDFAPTVIDYGSVGFPLAGGRLDYLDHRPVVALVYHRRKHAINLFLWPATQTVESAPQLESIQGYQLIHWTETSTNYWAISDLNAGELREFVECVRSEGHEIEMDRKGS